MAVSRKRGDDAGRRRAADAARARKEAARGELSDAARRHVEEAAVERGVPVGDEPLAQPEFGPFDVTVAPDDGLPRVDLGALKVPNLPETNIGIEAAPNGQITRIQLENAGGRLQLAVFAAPRTEGIWDEIREEIRGALLAGGAKVADVIGDYGPEIVAKLAPQGGGPAVDVRHLGIDGPRWFVHAVYVGPVAVDPQQALALVAALRGLVVDRGGDPRPVKEALPLRLPAEAAEQLAQQIAAAQAGGVA